MSSGVNRLKIQKITESGLKGRALSDALARELNGSPTKLAEPKIKAKKKRV